MTYVNEELMEKLLKDNLESKNFRQIGGVRYG